VKISFASLRLCASKKGRTAERQNGRKAKVIFISP
jgi:hypothetical protein